MNDLPWKLTPEECQQAREHWEALMFAPSRQALEYARRALGQAPDVVQQAVMGDIATRWLQESEPGKEDNPFGSPA